MYADDSTMYSAASECNELTDVLSSELVTSAPATPAGVHPVSS